MKRKLFIIGDAACDTGFATVTHNIINNLTHWDISVLAINYNGDPHEMQSKARLYNPLAFNANDMYGFNRVNPLVKAENPDVVLVINDPWIATMYLPRFVGTNVKKVAYMPVDAKHLKQAHMSPLNSYDACIAYTEFGKNELELAGVTNVTNVIPHGVDTSIFYPMDMIDTRRRIGIPEDWFIVNVTDRNQPRKRIDLALYAFSKWVKEYNLPDNVRLYYHGALKDEGWDIEDLASHFGIKERLIVSPSHTAGRGVTKEEMRLIYNIADVGLSTTLGEGWGLTTHERMACRIPMIVPKWSALSEWANGGVIYATVSDEPYYTPRGVNTEGRAPKVESIIDKLHYLYTSPHMRLHIADKGYELATQDKYKWDVIAQQFDTVFTSLME